MAAPGIKVQRIAGKSRTTVPSSSSAFGVVGYTYKGPVNVPTLVTSDSLLGNRFGGYNAKSVLRTVGAAFFLNGGSELYVTRVVGSGAVKATASIAVAGGDPAAISLRARDPGACGNDLRLGLIPEADSWDPTTGTHLRFTAVVYEETEGDGEFIPRETFEGCYLDGANANSLLERLNDTLTGSKLVEVLEMAGDPFAPADLIGVLTEDEDTGQGTLEEQATIALGEAVAKQTLEIHWTKTGGNTVVYAVDNGAGTLIPKPGHADSVGCLDTGGLNTVNYRTGAVKIKAAAGFGVKDATNYIATWRTTPATANLTVDFTGGDDGAVVTRAEISHPNLDDLNAPLGAYAWRHHNGMLMIAAPDFTGDPDVTKDLLALARGRRATFVLYTAPIGATYEQAADYKSYTMGSAGLYPQGAMYWPGVKIKDPLTNRTKVITCVGHVAGTIAATDAASSMGKAPAGDNDAGRLDWLEALERDVREFEVAALNPLSINCLYKVPGSTFAVWGARTAQIMGRGDFPYIQMQRVFDYVDQLLWDNTQWVVFENNGPETWTALKLQVEGMLRNLRIKGALAGASDGEAFLVVCGAANNPTDGVDRGELNCDISIATNKPAEFVTFRLRHLMRT